MSHRRVTAGYTALVGAGIAALIAGSLSFAQAHATEIPDPLSPVAASELATTLTSRLSGDAAGSYYDAETKRLVVNTVDEARVEAIEAEGAVAKVVEHTTAALDSARKALEGNTVAGTAWAVDPVTNKVVVTVDRTVRGDDLAQMTKTVAALGDRATLERSAGEFTPFLAGGDAIHTANSRCSLGFNVMVGGAPAFLTAGHCGQAGSSWSETSGGSEIGIMEASTFPGADHALVRYTSAVDAPSEVNLYDGTAQPITEAIEATVGMAVQRSGSTTQVHEGTVTGLNASVTYPQGTVHGLIKTDVCAEPGDSGGSLFAGSSAVGLTSGGSGNCTSGGQTFFQPVTVALQEYGAEIG